MYFKDLKRICCSCLNFIMNEPTENIRSFGNSDLNGWCTDPLLFYKALIAQKKRSLSRFQSLDQLMFHLVTREASPTVSNCIQQQLLEGCFGFCNVKNEETCTQLHHYLEGIQSSPIDIQEKIRTVVHGIYKYLAQSLKRQIINNSENKQLLLVTIFSLSTKYQSNDLNIVINNDLVQLLMQVINVNAVSTRPLNKLEIINVTALRLTHILALSCCIHSKKIDPVILENVINILHEQFLKTIEVFKENCISLQDCSYNSFNSSGSRQLGDFLLFLRIISSSRIIQKLLAAKKWIYDLLGILDTSNMFVTYTSQLKMLRPKLLILQLLQVILPGLQHVHIDDDLRKHVVNKLFNQLGRDMWNNLPISPEPVPNEPVDVENEFLDCKIFKEGEGNVPVHDVGFDPEKCFNCNIDGNLTLIHGTGGRGYGLGLQAIRSGCYQWKLLIVKENRGNEGTCIGISKYPVKDFSHRSTNDMWLYRAYSGSLYHNGERDMSFQSYTQGKPQIN